jgi:hypothetical protein
MSTVLESVIVAVRRKQSGKVVTQSFEPEGASFFVVPCPRCNTRLAVHGTKDDDMHIECLRHGVFKVHYQLT